MDWFSYVAIVLGTLLLLFSAWQRAGRSRNARAWLRAPGRRAVSNNMFLYPGLGAWLLSLGLIPLVEEAPSVAALPIVLLFIGGIFTMVIWGILRVPYPMALMPTWARDEVRKRKEAGRA